MAPEHQTFDSNLPCLIPVSGAFLKCLSVEVHFQFSLQMLCYSQMRCLLSLEVGRYWCVQKAESINSIQGRLRALALRLERTSACFVVPCLAVSDSGTSRTAARQAPLSLGFPRQEYWSGLPFLLQGIFLTQGSNLGLLHGRQILYRLSYRAFTFKSLLQHHSLKASILWHSAFFTVHSHIHTRLLEKP